MFKLQRPTNSNRPSKQREKVDFRFSNFQALQVPKGWDRLFVSLISVETGKSIGKLGKALVKNGSCQWTETVSESIYISRDDSSKGYEECLVKLLVSTGLTRSSILGEATINVAQYTSSRASAAVSQPLKKCSYGTILQVKIQCLTPRSKIRDEESRKSNSQEKDLNVDHHDTESKSNHSDGSSQDLAATSRPLKLDSKGTSQSASGSIRSYDSLEGSMEREDLSKNALKNNEECNSNTTPDHFSIEDDPPSNHQSSSNSSRMHLREDFRDEEAVIINRSSMTNLGSSRNLLEAAEDTIEELRVEAKMWERNARKLMIDLDISRKEFSDLSKKQGELVMEVSAAHAERDGLKREVQKLKMDLQQLTTNQAKREETMIQSEYLIHMQKVLANEIKYQQNLNDNLGEQLKRSQESNLELVSVLQELEETIEQQKSEIENLSSLKMDFTEMEKSIARTSEDNRRLQLQLEQLQESETKLRSDVRFLEEALRGKTDELENARKSSSRIEEDFKYKLSVKEEEIASLEAKLSGYKNNVDLVKEMDSLREKVQELEKDCVELTDENLELLFKIKDSNKTNIRKCGSFDSITSEHPNASPSDESEVSDPKFQIFHKEDELKENECEKLQHELTALRDNVSSLVSDKADLERNLEEIERKKQELENTLSGLQEENMHLKECVCHLETQARQLKDEKEFYLQEAENLKSVTSSLQDEIQQMKVEMDIQILDLKQKSEDMEKQWLAAQEECEHVKTENRELHANCARMEAQLSESKKSLLDCSKKVELLEDRLTSVLDDFAMRKNSMKSELDALVKEISYYKEKTEDFGSLQKENDVALQDSELKVQDLTGQLADSKQNYEKLVADHERILKTLANYKRSEEKLKTDINELELKLTISDYERQQLSKETSILKGQLQNMSALQGEISVLKGELNECGIDKDKLEVALQTVCEDYEKLKAEKSSFSEKMSVFQDAVSELEECKRAKLAFGEKLLKMENELAEKEIVCGQYYNLKNELSEVKRAMYRLEEERDECLKKAQALEENLKLMEDRNNFIKQASKRSGANGEVVARERYERTKSSLETELRDLRERYLEMSLKYAEVEAEREDLVMKLKATKGGKRWFS